MSLRTRCEASNPESQGAIIYVCGDGGRMEPDVKAALVAIHREHTGADAGAGHRWIEDLGADNR